jgi:hypothetical protein
LLDGELKQSILARFDVRVISHYFLEFERQLPPRLQWSPHVRLYLFGARLFAVGGARPPA